MTQAYPLQWRAGWPRVRERSRAKFSEGKEVRGSSGSGSYRWSAITAYVYRQ